MAGITLEKGQTVYTYGQPMTALHLITNGKIQVTYPGGSFYLNKGGVIGICEICSEIHFFEYTVAEDATIVTYSFSNLEVLDDLLEKHPDVARLFLLSAFYQINTLMERCSVASLDCSSLHQNLTEDYRKYIMICNRYRITPRFLENFEEQGAYLGEEAPDFWLSGFYLGLSRVYAGDGYKTLIQDPALSSGFLRKCALDIRRTFTGLDEQARYQEKIADMYFHESGNDLFDFFTALYYKLGSNSEEAEELLRDINRMITQFENTAYVDSDYLEQRVRSFRNSIAMMQAPTSSRTSDEDYSDIINELAGSLNKILEYAGHDLDVVTSFRQNVHAYKQLTSKSATDDDSCKLRAKLTEEFNHLYSLIFEQTLQSSDIPIPVLMFLYFGYVDEELAGIDNAIQLYLLALKMHDHTESGFYTLYDWLLAIYHGKKEPSRNEFEQDYNDYIHKQKLNNTISDAEARDLEDNTLAKVHYELHNMFPPVNKMTFGRISTFCPLFTEENVLKNLGDTYVTASAVGKIFTRIKQIDYTAFYRESLDTENMNLMGKELIHTEYMPDIILMPNVGIRGVMWQEIEGKRRGSSGRMMLPIFHLEDLHTTLLRLTGEFRWELCKRVQGNRWNDVTERSLTSEYFDYIQFYRKNHDLSSEAKERLHTSLQRAKNSFKEMFIRDYITWIMFEGTGAPRLNKVARKILFTYCPFPAALRTTLKQNPLFSDLLSRQEIQTAQKLHRLNGLMKKIQNNGHGVPETLTREIAYTAGTSDN